MKEIIVRIPEELYKQLKVQSLRMGVSINSLVIFSISYVATNEALLNALVLYIEHLTRRRRS
ncbi:MAG: hypothetical protein QXI50_05700 [Candidatus Caldarchaeum sp.]